MIARYLYQNPRILLLVACIIVITGLSAYVSLARMEDPTLTRRVALVTTIFPGANAERVESLVSQKLERLLVNVTGIGDVQSVSMAGFSVVTIELNENVDTVDAIWSRVRDRLTDAASVIPPEAHAPQFRELELKAYAAIVGLTWQGERPVNLSILARLAKDLEQLVRSVNGTENVALHGKPDEEILVQLRPTAVSPLGLTVADIARQLQESDAKQSAGLLRNDANQLLIEVGDEFDSLERLGATPVQYGQQGRLVALADIATISKTRVEPPTGLAFVDEAPAIVLGAFVRDEHRIDLWSTRLQETLDEFQAALPPDVKLDVILSQNAYVERRLEQLLWNLLLGMGAVIGVVFFLLGWRSTLVIGTALPLSALMVLTGMRWLDIPIHQMSITGLIIALGLLIDNAIVIVDEIRSRMWSGMSPLEAITDGIRHLALPLFGSTLTTTLAFTPIALLPGAPGEFVGSIAISVILAINASFLLAMSVVPALTALLQPARRQGTTFWNYGFQSDRLTEIYRYSLRQLFRFPLAGIALGACLPIFGFLQWDTLREQFFPASDRAQIHIEFELPAPTSLAATEALTRAARQTLAQHEDIRRVHWFLGESAPTFYYNVMPRRVNAAHYAQAIVELQPGVSPPDAIHQLQDELDAQFAECRVLVRQLEQGPPFDAPIEVRLFGPDLATLQQLGSQLRLVLSETTDVVHTRSDLEEALPKIALAVDREAMRLTGMTHGEMSRQLFTSLEGMNAGTIAEGTEELLVRVRLDTDVRSNLDSVASLELKPLTPRGRAPQGPTMDALARPQLGSEVSAIPRSNGRRMNEVKAYVTAGTLPAEVLAEFESRLAASTFELPPGYSLEYGGEVAKRDEAVTNLVADIAPLVAIMIATLVFSFRSFRVSLIIAAVGGLSIGLGLWALWLFNFPFGFMAIVGTMGLVGVAINDAIVVMAEIRDDPQARMGDSQAISEVVVRCTRHVVATSLTTMAGFAPLVLGGGGFWPPLAVAISGGVGGATILALYFVPSLYLLLLVRKSQRKTPNSASSAPTVAAEPITPERPN